MAKFLITVEEAIAAVRKHYQLPESVEIEIKINHDLPIAQDVCDWYDVPHDWKFDYAPAIAGQYRTIAVMKRSGEIMIGESTDWNVSWCQNGSINDIVKFRGVNDF